MNSMPINPTIMVGLSGASSSGKTTLARLLRRTFDIPRSEKTRGRSSSVFLLHQDDFYAAEDAVPTITTTSAEHGVRELKNYEGVDSVDLRRFTHALRGIKMHGTLPSGFKSKEDENEVHDIDLDESRLRAAKEHVQFWLSMLNNARAVHLNICIAEGWLLFPDPTRKRQNTAAEKYSKEILSLMDIKLFLRSTLAIVKSRRACRSGYVMQEHFWVDPPGYVEEVVWPVYVKEHSWLFDGPDVESSELKPRAIAGENGTGGILTAPGLGDSRIEEVLEWAVEKLTTEISRLVCVWCVQSSSDVG